MLISYVKPVLHLFNTSMLLIQEEDKDLAKTLNEVYKCIDVQKYKHEATQELLDVTSCLDPRFKIDFISADSKPQGIRDVGMPGGDIKLQH